MFPFDLPNVLRPFFTEAMIRTEITDADNKVTVSAKDLFYLLQGILAWQRISLSDGKKLLV